MEEREWAQSTLTKIAAKYLHVIPSVAKDGRIPYWTVNGKFEAYDENNWWTNGFWPAILWQLNAFQQDDAFVKEARRAEDILALELSDPRRQSHDVGFLYLISCGADYKLTGNEEALKRTLLAADLLMARMNVNGFFRAWNELGKEGWSIVDTMMNLPILYFANRIIRDPRYTMAAQRHADTCMEHFVRMDGSCNHIVIFDPITGEQLETPAGQGAYAGSSWSRGQAWGLYGFTLSHLLCGEKRYLDTAKRIAHYFIANILDNGQIQCDFRQTEGDGLLDDIAGACGACGLLELSKAVPERESSMYRRAALRILHGLDKNSACWDPMTPGVLQNCTSAYSVGASQNIIYGDYFFTEAMMKLCEIDPMLWM